MTVKTFYFQDAVATGSNFGKLTETNDTAATSGTGWEVGCADVRFPGDIAEIDYGVEIDDAAAGWGTTLLPNATLDNASGDALRSEDTISETFLSGIWTLTVKVIAVTVGGTQDGRCRARVFKSASATGASGVTEITTATLTTSKATDLTTATAQTLTVTFNPGVVAFNAEYLFLSLAWEITGASISGWNTSNVTLAPGSNIAGVTGVASEGEYAEYTVDANNTIIYQTFSGQTANRRYKASVWVKTNTGTKDFKLSRTDTISWDNTYSTTSGILTATTSWQRFYITYVTGPGETSSSIVIGSEQRDPDFNCTVGIYYFWGFTNEEIDGQTVKDSWTESSSTIYNDGVTAPEPTEFGHRFTLDSASNTACIYRNYTVPVSTQHTIKAYIWTNTGTKDFRISRNDGVSWGDYKVISDTFTATTTPQEFTITYTTGPAETTSHIQIGSEADTPFQADVGTYYIWNIRHYVTGTTPPVTTSRDVVLRTYDTKIATTDYQAAVSMAGQTDRIIFEALKKQHFNRGFN